jgi:hypothetical protein
LTVALDAITIAADVVPSTVPNLSPQAVACISAVPDAVTVVADVIQGSQPIATAQTAVTSLQKLLGTSCLVSAIPAKDQAVIAGITKAISTFLTLYQQQVGSTPAATAAIAERGYALGFATSPNPATAKVKASRADKKKAKEAATRAKKIKAAIAKAKVN